MIDTTESDKPITLSASSVPKVSVSARILWEMGLPCFIFTMTLVWIKVSTLHRKQQEQSLQALFLY